MPGPLSHVPYPGHNDRAYLMDRTVSSERSGDNIQALSEELVMLDDGSLSGSETSLVESSHLQFTEFMIPSEQNPHLQHQLNLTEVHIATNLPESQYMYHSAVDGDLSVGFDTGNVRAENYIIAGDSVKRQSEVAFVASRDSKPSIAEVAVAQAVMTADEKECAFVETGRKETSMHGGVSSSAADACDEEVSALPFDTESHAVVAHLPSINTTTAVMINDNHLSITDNNASELLVRDHCEGIPPIDFDSLKLNGLQTDLEDKSLDCGWDGSPSDVGDDGKVRDHGASGVSRIIPVTSTQLANTSGENVSVLMLAGSQSEVRDEDPSEEDEEYCQSTAVSGSDEDLLVLVNFRITADHYEGESMASETRESFSRMIVRQSDVLPKWIPSCPTPTDWMDLCSTENRQFYLVQKRKTNVELSGESLMTTATGDGRASDFGQSNLYCRDVRDTIGGRMRQVADQSVTNTTRVMKHVIVTKTETTTSVDDTAEHRPENVHTEIRDSSSVDKKDDGHETTWMKEIVRRSRLETRDSFDSGATDVGESRTTGYFSVSEDYDREDTDDSFSSCLEELETLTDVVVGDTMLVVSDDNNTETTEITADGLKRADVAVGVSELREIMEHEICVVIPDDDDSKRNAVVGIMESDETKVAHTVGVYDSVELQETEVCDVMETGPVGIFSLHPVSLESACENTAVKTHEVANYVQIIEAVDGRITEDDRLADIREIDTSVVRPGIVISKVTAPDTVVIATKRISVIEDKAVQTPASVDIETRDGLDADSDMNERGDSSKSIILAGIVESGDIMLENVSDIEETGVESLSLVDHELQDTVLECTGVETFVQRVSHSCIICDEASTVASFSETEAHAVSPDVVTAAAFDTAAQLERKMYADAVVDDLAGRYAADDGVVTEMDMAERYLLHSLSADDDTCDIAVTEQIESCIELQLSDVTDSDLLGDTFEIKSGMMCPVTTVCDETDYLLDQLVIKTDSIERISPEIVTFVDNGSVKSEEFIFRVDSMTSDETEEHAEQVDTSAVPAVVADVEVVEVIHTAVMQNRVETWVQAAVNVDEDGSEGQQSVTECDDVGTCTVIPNVVTDDVFDIAITAQAITARKIETSVITDSQTEGNDNVCGESVNVAEICSVSADVRDASSELPDTETSIAVQVLDDRNVISEFTEPVSQILSHCIVTEEVESVSAADVQSGRTETYVAAVQEHDDNEVSKITSLNELQISTVLCLDVSDENISKPAVKSGRVETHIEAVRGDVSSCHLYDAVSDLKDIETCNLDLAVNDKHCLDTAAAIKSGRLETCVGETVTDCAAALESVDTLTVDKSEVCISDACTVSEASSTVFVNTVRFQTEREIIVRTREGAMVDDTQRVETGANVMSTDDGRNIDTLREVKTGDIPIMSDACTETPDDRQIYLTHETQSTACQTDGNVVDFQHLQQKAGAVSVGSQTFCPRADAATAEMVDEGYKPFADSRLFYERDIVNTVQTDEDATDTVISISEGVDRVNSLSTASQTDDVDSISLSTAETQTGGRETSAEPCGTADQVATADVHTLATVDVAAVETQTLPSDISSTTEAQTSTVPVDLVSIHTQTMEHEADKLMVEAETCTTPIEVAVIDRRTSLDKDLVSTSEAQTSTDPVELEGIETRRLGYEVTVEDETCTTPVNLAVVGTQTSVDIISAAGAQTSITPVGLVIAATQTVWTDDDDYSSRSHSIDTSVIHTLWSDEYDSVLPYTERLSDISSFPNILLQPADELEVSDSSSGSIYLEDYSSSAETLYTDADEDFMDVLRPDSSLKTDSDKVNVDSVLEDMQAEPSKPEHTGASLGNIYLPERDSCSEQGFDDKTGHIIVPGVEIVDPRGIPTSYPASPFLVSTERQPASSDAESTQSQVCSSASDCGDG